MAGPCHQFLAGKSINFFAQRRGNSFHLLVHIIEGLVRRREGSETMDSSTAGFDVEMDGYAGERDVMVVD